MTLIADIWPSKNCLSFGCCISGPRDQWYGSLCFYISAVICIVVVSVIATPIVWVEVSPLLPLAFYICVTLTGVFLNLTACTDPGIIPRRPFIEKMRRKLNTNNISEEQHLAHFYDQFLDVKCQQLQPQNQNLTVFYQRQSHRYCQTCHIYRPPRASHCGTCDNCVLVFDHHCGFINNCIGMRNYRFFILFLVGVCFSAILFVINMVVFGILKSGTEVSTIVIIVISSVGVVCIGGPLVGFLGYHCFLMVTGKTTRQALKKLDNNSSTNENPNQKVYQNLWCSSQKPMINIFSQIPQQQADQLRQQLEEQQRHAQQNKKKVLEQYYKQRQKPKLSQKAREGKKQENSQSIMNIPDSSTSK